jgi:hypothetical protein
MIVNDREIFLKRKIGKRSLNNNYTIGWSCKNKPSCTASITSTRDFVDYMCYLQIKQDLYMISFYIG